MKTCFCYGCHQSNWKFWVAVEMADPKAADHILTYRVEKALQVAFQKLFSSELDNAFICVQALLTICSQPSDGSEEQMAAELEAYC